MKIEIPGVTSQFNTSPTITARLEQIENEFNSKVLYRANPPGEPNAMGNDLDMAFNRILNLPPPNTLTSPIRLQDMLGEELIISLAGVKVAVINDSFLAQHSSLEDSPVTLTQARLSQQGSIVQFIQCGRDAHTFNKARTVELYGGMTSVEYAISLEPDVVVVALGFNDLVLNIEGRSLAQVQADAASLFSELAAGLPGKTLVYASEVPWDRAVFPTPSSSLKNKGTISALMATKSSGILTGFRTSEILEDSVSSTNRTRIGNWVTADSYIKGLGDVHTTFDINIWKIHRLGGNTTDGLHFSNGGYQLAAGYLVKGLATLTSVFPTYSDNGYPVWDDPDVLFSTALTALSDGYVPTGSVEAEAANFTNNSLLHRDRWYLNYSAELRIIPDVNNTSDTVYSWFITNAPKDTVVELSVDGGAFVDLSVVTDAQGNAWYHATGNDLYYALSGVGTYTLRYKVGSVVLGPVTFNIVNKVVSWVTPSFVNGWINYDPTTPAGYQIDEFRRVHLRGVIKNGISGANAFVLPIGFRPLTNRIFPSIAGGLIAAVEVFTNGAVFVTGNTAGLALDGIYFDTR